MTLLAVENLSVRDQAGKALVEDVSFAVAPGDRTGLIGESGSGKSLTALAVTGLLPPGLTATGEVLLDGVDMIRAPERRRTGVRGRVASVVFQEPLTALDPLMPAGRQIAGPLRRFGGLKSAALDQAVRAALEEVRLTDTDRIARAYPHQLSGGQRQRVAIAMALACRPRLLIADEPTTALDVTVQAEILDLLDRLVEVHGTALLFITHDLPVVARVARQAHVLRAGRIVESGPITSLIARPANPYTRTLVDSARRFDAALTGAGRPSQGPDLEGAGHSSHHDAPRTDDSLSGAPRTDAPRTDDSLSGAPRTGGAPRTDGAPRTGGDSSVNDLGADDPRSGGGHFEGDGGGGGGRE
ncbi:ATP-binding cassette domain-containing protein [Paractinoplanes maris]|uniref:ATP-binding cassette domain-containing protein n=1 Tax=Paractinoplanes maris TaxID=1734446 RepID=UPI0020207D6A|nr:ABC transporter ATP-binding protein [Actinoplanes maris]